MNKWEPLVCYSSSGDDFMVFARRNKISGMVSFRTKKINSIFHISHGKTVVKMDIQGQWEKVMSGNG